MTGPTGGRGDATFTLRCAEHDVDFAWRCLVGGSISSLLVSAGAAEELAGPAARAAATMFVAPPADLNPFDLDALVAAQRFADVLCSPPVTVTTAGRGGLDAVERVAQVTDPRPVVATVSVSAVALADAAGAGLANALRDAGADGTLLTVPDADWHFAGSTQLDALLAVVDSFTATGVTLVIDGAERIGPGLIAAGAAGFASALPDLRRDPHEPGGLARPAGYAEPGRWREIDAFAAQPGAVAPCPWPGCRALSSGRTRGDLREHRAHAATAAARAAAADPDALIEELRRADMAYVSAWGARLAALRSAAA